MIIHKTAAAIIEKNGKFLLIQRKNIPEQGYWALPGGHVDEGETIYEAACREMKEEVGYIELEKKPLFSFVHDVRIGHRHECYVFRGAPSGKIKASSDASAIKWMSLKELNNNENINFAHFTALIFNKLYRKQL
ncbi:MAG: NUDIX hydrolase [Candidatus Aenigmarchaeota archaeon]|nr:NUDIX hydrolase [Candidatus Aenigmarchaeota archaeon]